MDLNNRLPILAHSSIPGVDCCGCLIARSIPGGKTELACNECGAVLLTADDTILRDLVEMIPDLPKARVN